MGGAGNRDMASEPVDVEDGFAMSAMFQKIESDRRQTNRSQLAAALDHFAPVSTSAFSHNRAAISGSREVLLLRAGPGGPFMSIKP